MQVEGVEREAAQAKMRGNCNARTSARCGPRQCKPSPAHPRRRQPILTASEMCRGPPQTVVEAAMCGTSSHFPLCLTPPRAADGRDRDGGGAWQRHGRRPRRNRGLAAVHRPGPGPPRCPRHGGGGGGGWGTLSALSASLGRRGAAASSMACARRGTWHACYSSPVRQLALRVGL